MGAATKACKVANTIKNTGIECGKFLGPAAMLIPVPKTLKWTDQDMEDFTAYLKTQIHAARESRIFPLFGNAAPIRDITPSKDSDVIVTLGDGSKVFLLYGFINTVYSTTDGGLCLAQVLQSLNQAGYNIIKIDQLAQAMFRNNGDGTYSGLRYSFMFAPSPDEADFKNPAKNNFQTSLSPIELVQKGEIYQLDFDVLDLMGLIDCIVTDATGSSTTKLKIGVQTECADTDLVALLGSPLATLGNFVITNKATGATVTASAVAIVGGHIELTGTFTSAATYTVALAAPSVLFTNNIEGYEGVQSVDILIP